MQTTQAPVNWVRDVGYAVQWPFVVCAAYWLGRSTTKLEARVLTAEKALTDLVTRHMPHMHNALSRIESSLESIKAVVFSRN